MELAKKRKVRVQPKSAGYSRDGSEIGGWRRKDVYITLTFQIAVVAACCAVARVPGYFADSYVKCYALKLIAPLKYFI